MWSSLYPHILTLKKMTFLNLVTKKKQFKSHYICWILVQLIYWIDSYLLRKLKNWQKILKKKKNNKSYTITFKYFFTLFFSIFVPTNRKFLNIYSRTAKMYYICKRSKWIIIRKKSLDIILPLSSYVMGAHHWFIDSFA